MPIDKLVIKNFKGIADREEFEIRPITIFCGPNSSGKSSCIHALAALAQTVKLSGSQVPVVLDDEYAQVHLGRFLDVVHSKNIKDSFSIGVGMKQTNFLFPSSQKKSKPAEPEPINIEITFKAKKAAQEIYIQSLRMSLGDTKYEFTKKKDEYSVKKGAKTLEFNVVPTGKFSFRPNFSFAKSGKPDQDVMDVFFTGENVTSNLNAELSRVLYLGPFRQGPLRRYATRGSQPTEVGASGDSAVAMLANEFSRSATKHPNLAKISEWIVALNLGKKVHLESVANTDLFDVSLTLEDGAKLSVPDLGYGISQVLPVLVQCSFAPKGATLLFEQPELHLHEGAARKLGGIFVDVVKSKGVHILAETHSPHLFYEIIQQVKQGNLSPDDVVLYDVSRKQGKSEFRKVLIEKFEDGACEVDHPWINGLK